jgi:hypothetical protein
MANQGCQRKNIVIGGYARHSFGGPGPENKKGSVARPFSLFFLPVGLADLW